MTVEDAQTLFQPVPILARKLDTLMDVGLGYIKLGQSATTLSGGEAQRVKLSRELSKRDTGRTLYILDEPTTGLHFHDIEQLLKVLHRLADDGNTVVVIEHNLDVIKTADWVIDLGPEGGVKGGAVVGESTPVRGPMTRAVITTTESARFWRTTVLLRRASRKASTSFSRSSAMRATSAVSSATSVPAAPMATPTLSGGEAQRIKLVTELSKVRDDVTRRGNKAPHTLYVLDEPTVGLHMADVERLIRVLHRLVDGGHSVVVIEHDLDVIAEADWVIDLGPEGGHQGGVIVVAGAPEAVVAAGSHTGKALEPVLAR
jgi:excinuclease UvrABC ATPase subunit